MGFLDSINRRGIGETARRIHENVVWDIADGAPSARPPLKAYEPIPSEASRLPVIDRLFNPYDTDGSNLQGTLREQVSILPTGSYAMRQHVGKTKEGTGHSHYFVIDRSNTDTTLLFVDPEHYLNRSPRRGKVMREGDIRPKVCNLMAVRFHDGATLPDVAITRFRTATLDNPELVTFETQLEAARNLFKDEGMPQEIRDHPEEIICGSL